MPKDCTLRVDRVSGSGEFGLVTPLPGAERLELFGQINSSHGGLRAVA